MQFIKSFTKEINQLALPEFGFINNTSNSQFGNQDSSWENFKLQLTFCIQT